MKRYIEWIIRHRVAVIAATLMLTALAVFQARSIKIIIDPATMMPQSHPYVSTSTQVEKVFGSKHVVVIGIRPHQGDIYQPAVLEKVQRLTAAFQQVPGVVRENLLSLAAKRAKDIAGNADGLQVVPLMSKVPDTPEKMAALRKAVHDNPVYENAIVSKDGSTTAVIVEFRDEPNGFRTIMDKVEPIVERERDATVDIHIGGLPNFLARIEIFSERMGIFLPIAIVILCLVLFEAFRTKQGLLLPLVTAALAVAWGVGFMGASGIPMDVFNATTPILILAVATGHAVQLLKRYYEEYYRFSEIAHLAPREANHQAVVASPVKVGPVMIAAGTVASLGFFSLMVFEISTVRTFGIFTGLGILAALILELTFIPALRSLLSPPPARKATGAKRRIWLRLTDAIARQVTGPRRGRVYAAAGLFVTLALLGMTRVIEDNSVKKYFDPTLVFQRDDHVLNKNLGGTNTLYLLIEGDRNDAIKEPQTLKAMVELQHFLEQEANVGKTLSMADFVRRMNRAMHGDDPAFDTIPESQELVSQYLLLYSMSGDPGDFDSYVDYDYRQAKITALLKTDSTAYIEQLIARIKAHVGNQFGDGIKVRIGGSAPQDAALNQAMVEGKILNIVQIAAVVFVISSLIFRSLVAGALVLLPLMIVVLANFGLMGWSGILLNIPTSLTSAMAVGIGADYAIYLIYRLREELSHNPDEKAAVRHVLGTAGEAIMFVAVAVAAGYGVLLLSPGFYIHTWLAILIATAMLVSALAALLLIPSLILTLRPAFIFGGRSTRNNLAPATMAMLALGVGLAAQPPHADAATEQELSDIMTRNAQVSKVIDSTTNATFTLINDNGQSRVRKVFGTTKLQENGNDNMRMTRFVSPPDVKGTATLLVEHAERDDDIWVYLPALKKVRRLVSSNKRDSFVGTDFSYADVIGHRVAEWQYKLLREETVDGQPCMVIESLPKNDSVRSSTGYSKRLDWIRKDNLMTVRSDYWDEANQPLKTSLFTELELVDPKRNKWQAMKLEARNLQTGHRTEIRFENFKTNQQVKNDYFTAGYLERE